MVFTFSTAALAQNKPIDEMFKVMSMDKQMSGGFEAMLPMIDQMTIKFKLDSEQKEELKNVFRTWFNEDLDREKMKNEFKRLYASNFTDAEIVKITEFYKTPVGVKFLEKSSHLMQQGAQIGMEEAQAKQAKLMERMQAFLVKHDIKQ